MTKKTAPVTATPSIEDAAPVTATPPIEDAAPVTATPDVTQDPLYAAHRRAAVSFIEANRNTPARTIADLMRDGLAPMPPAEADGVLQITIRGITARTSPQATGTATLLANWCNKARRYLAKVA